MDTIILVPGGGGSKLKLGNEEIWPPTIPEYVGGYFRTSKLVNAAVKATKILDSIGCYGIYEPLQDDLNKIANSCGSRRVDFAYDWRKDVMFTADQLALKIKSCIKNSASDTITLVCHSMGNLLARAILESGDYSSKPWFNNIKRYVGICGPHFGVPVILEYALGVKSWLGISKIDMKNLSADSRYPSCYQCLPFEGVHDVLFDIQSGTPQPKNFYNPAVATAFGLSQPNLVAATNLHAKLKLSNRPVGVDYRLIAGSNHTTHEGIEFDGSTFNPFTDPLGDSTIPLWSSKPPGIAPPTEVTPGDHVDVLKSYPFRQILYRLLACAGLEPALTLLDLPGVTISLNEFIYAPNEPIEVLIIPDLRTQEISGSLEIARVVGPEARRFVRYQEQPFVYRGPQISFIRSTLTAPADPGAYRVTFRGSHGTSPRTAGGFVVSNQEAMRQLERTRQK
jgi:hypothetical protein